MDASLRANQWTIDLQTLMVMPDHVHMIFTPLVDLERAEIFSLARITKAIKGTAAHLINRQLGRPGRVWQAESFDRVLWVSEKWMRRLLIFSTPREEGIGVFSKRIPLLVGGAKTGAELRSAGQVRTPAPTRAVRIIGVISDTHGLLRPEALAALHGSDHIIHAGDIGDPVILKTLAEIAPVTAVRGNVDREAWAKKIPSTNVLEVGGISIYVLHNLNELDLKPEAAGFDVVVCGHSHVAKQEMKNGVLYFNPDSSGPRRFRLPVTVGRLHVKHGKASAEIVEIFPGG